MVIAFRSRGRGRRPPLLACEQARLLARLLAAPPKVAPAVDLLPLFRRIWQHGGTSSWTVCELARLGLVDPRATTRLGRDLRRQFELDVPVGPFWLRQHDREREGRTWSIERR